MSHSEFIVTIPSVVGAMKACAEEFLSPPVANLGNRGIRTASVRVGSLLQRAADPERDLLVISNIMERAGTGGALFRNLYRDFLTEAHELLSDRPAAALVASARDGFAQSARLWTSVAQSIGRAGATGEQLHLTEASEHLIEIESLETTAMTTLRSL